MADLVEGIQANVGSSHFAGASNFNIGYQINVAPHGNVTLNVNNTPPNIKDTLEPILGATHRRDRKRFPPNSTCLPGTREGVLKQIKAWANSGIVLKDDVSHVLWLHGYVGSGKSAIAQTIAEKFAKKGRLAASFFFFRGDGDRSRSARFVKTLAGELASAIPSTMPAMKKAIAEYAGLLTTSPLELQFQHLFLEPFRAALRNPGRLAQRLLTGPVVTVIDGLDECEDREEVASFMTRMAEFYREHPRTPLRFFISSRVEEHIRSRITKIGEHTQVELVDLAHHGSQDDIALIVDQTFKRAAQEERVVRSYGEWPSPEDRLKLVEHADGSFILISTILRFILESSNDERSPKDRLAIALNFRTGLDEMYLQLLAQAEALPHFASVLSTILLVQAPLSIYQLADLHSVEAGRVIPVLVNLHAVLQVPDDDASPITLCHSSFREFLSSERRSGRFHVPQSQHRLLAHQCLEHLARGSPNDVNSFAAYGRNSFQFHWKLNIAARRGSVADIQDELYDIIVHCRGVVSPPVRIFVHSALANYTLMDRHWVLAISKKNKSISIAGLLARFAGISPSKGQIWFPVTTLLEAVDHCVGALSLSDSEARAVKGPSAVICEAMDPPLSSIQDLLPQHTHIAYGCISHLFMQLPPNMKSSGEPKVSTVFLPMQENNHDIFDYAFWAFSHHLELAARNDPGFTLAFLLAKRDPPPARNCPNREDLLPFHFLTHQSRYFVKFDPGEKLTTFKQHFEAASATIESLLHLQTLSNLPSLDDWVFRSSSVGEDREHKITKMIFGCTKDDYSIFNMWLGYRLLTQCFISWMDGSHDDETCLLHRKYQAAEAQEEGREGREGSTQTRGSK